jgi:DNA mismatch repair protein MutH
VDYEELTQMIQMDETPSANLGRFLQVRPKALSSKVRANINGALKAPIGFYLRAKYTQSIFKDFI